ncbi:MAG: ribosomal protein S18-alanine N-acetyltransferase [Microbacteriaceae bacterium]
MCRRRRSLFTLARRHRVCRTQEGYLVTWELRRAHADDLDAIMAIETSTFESDAWSPQNMASELASPHAYYLVAERDGVEAYAGLFAPRGSEQADIQTIAVNASARRQGLGRVLMQTMIGEARARGARELFLDVRADNPGAQALYESLGFEQIAVRAGYYQPDNVDALVMRLHILPAETRPA